jgi:hypothetical protein
MASKYMKCSNSLIIKEIQSKLHLDFILPQFKWPYSRAITTTTNAGRDSAKQELLYTVGGNAD